jgi:GGDEF domain-containing protein
LTWAARPSTVSRPVPPPEQHDPMAAEWTVLYHDPAGAEPPELLLRFASARDIEILSMDSAEAVIHQVNRAIPAALVIQGGGALGAGEAALELCSRIKSDAFTAVLPVAVIVEDDDDARTLPPLERGADEVVVLARGEAEAELRLDLLLRRATRDISVHPTTRLPGTPQIDRDTTARLRRGEPFAFCYADLDYFKEFNDRYGYNRGDRVIYLVSLILRDLVRGLAPGGFVGHIGGDDFIFIVPLDRMEDVCEEVIDLFDELMPFQYSESDRDAGYFLGRDRRGTLHRVPLMTLSIGVVTNLSHTFRHPAQVSSRAGEMKSYAKTLPGSVYVVDRRHGNPSEGRGRSGGESRVATPSPVPAKAPE